MTKSQIMRRYLAHLGIILCHLSILGVVLILGSFFSILLSILVFLVGICIILLTVGTIFLFVPNYWNKIVSTVNFIQLFSATSETLVPIIATITAVCCIASIVLTALDTKWQKAKIRLIISSVMVGVVVGLAIVVLLGIIGGASR